MSSAPNATAATISITLDCPDPRRLAAFWTAALGYVQVGAVDNFVVLGPTATDAQDPGWPCRECVNHGRPRTGCTSTSGSTTSRRRSPGWRPGAQAAAGRAVRRAPLAVDPARRSGGQRVLRRPRLSGRGTRGEGHEPGSGDGTDVTTIVDEYDAIRRAVQLCLDGEATGDVAKLREAFHPDARMFGSLAGERYDVPITELFALAASAPADTGSYRSRILTVQQTGDAAVAVLAEEGYWGTVSFVDYLALAKIGGTWRIVSRLFAPHRRRTARAGLTTFSAGARAASPPSPCGNRGHR